MEIKKKRKSIEILQKKYVRSYPLKTPYFPSFCMIKITKYPLKTETFPY